MMIHNKTDHSKHKTNMYEQMLVTRAYLGTKRLGTYYLGI